MSLAHDISFLRPERRTVRVLVVDDTPALRALTRVVLRDTAFEVVGEAGDGLAGVALAAELQPDLVLLDLAMPVMDGLEALPRLREEAPGARIVIASGFERKAMESQVLAAGADAYLQKGLPPQAVLAMLHSMFPTASAREVPHVPPQRGVDPARQAPVEERVRALEEDLEELLYVVSHDLSEPVHVVKGFAERLALRARSEEEAEFCGFITDAAGRMQQLLDDLLAYARAGRGELPTEVLNCRQLVEGVVAGLGTAIARSAAVVTVGDLPRAVAGSRLVLTQVLHNLLANAVKFVPAGVTPQVRIEASLDGDRALFQVQDNGIGIDVAQADRVFHPFTRLHSRETYPGSGVGLAICRRLVERSGGRIWLESGGSGTTFFVELPHQLEGPVRLEEIRRRSG